MADSRPVLKIFIILRVGSGGTLLGLFQLGFRVTRPKPDGFGLKLVTGLGSFFHFGKMVIFDRVSVIGRIWGLFQPIWGSRGPPNRPKWAKMGPKREGRGGGHF